MRRSRSFDVNFVDSIDVVSAIMGSTPAQLAARFNNNEQKLREAVFNRARELKILVIR